MNLKIFEESILIFRGDIDETLILLIHFDKNFVINIRKIAYMINIITAVCEPPLEKIVRQKCSEIAYMSEVVDCWATTIYYFIYDSMITIEILPIE